MAQVTIVYWRDIPGQVIVGRGRRAAKHPLPERFEQAIDRAAMKAGLAGSDEYLSAWRKEVVERPDAAPEALAEAMAAELDAAHPKAVLIELINNFGHKPEQS